MSIRAQYETVCQEGCGQLVEPGEAIEHRGEAGGWRHVACPDSADEAADAAALTHPRCARCDTNHPGDC